MPQRGESPSAIIHDTQGIYMCVPAVLGSAAPWGSLTQIPSETEELLLSKSITLTMSSTIEACLIAVLRAEAADVIKMRLYIDGVQQGETGYLTAGYYPYSLMSNKACSDGARFVQGQAYNYGGTQKWCSVQGGVFGGASKL